MLPWQGEKFACQGFLGIFHGSAFSRAVLSWVRYFKVKPSLNFPPSNSCSECDCEFTRCMESKNKRLHQAF